MRKVLGLFAAVALMLPVGVISAGSAGAANTVLPKCKTLTGTQTYKPGLPPVSSNKLVKPVTTTNAQIKGCVGGGITSGKSSGSLKATTGTNCKKLIADTGKPGKPTPAKITWSNGQTSTVSNTITVTGSTPTALKAKLVTKYTGGLGKGKTVTAQILATPNKGYCTSAPLNKVTFKSTSIK